MLEADFKIVTRPNSSLPVSGQKKVFGLIALFTSTVAFGFSMAGAWLVMPFAGLELVALAVGFYYLNGCSEDYESITIVGNRLVVEKCTRKIVVRTEFNRYWVQVMVKVCPDGMQRLGIRSHGREVLFGRFMNDEQRFMLTRELKSMTGVSYQN